MGVESGGESSNMILSDEEVESRLESSGNLCVVVKKSGNGRSSGSSNLEDPVRELIGKLAVAGGDRTEIAEEFGVSESVVSKTSKGLVGNRYDKDLDRSNKSGRVIEEKTETAHEKALDVMMQTLGAISPRLSDPENLVGIKTKDLSKIARDMSSIVGSLSKKNEDSDNVGNKTQVVIVVPSQKSESDYEAVSVRS